MANISTNPEFGGIRDRLLNQSGSTSQPDISSVINPALSNLQKTTTDTSNSVQSLLANSSQDVLSRVIQSSMLAVGNKIDETNSILNDMLVKLDDLAFMQEKASSANQASVAQMFEHSNESAQDVSNQMFGAFKNIVSGEGGAAFAHLQSPLFAIQESLQLAAARINIFSSKSTEETLFQKGHQDSKLIQEMNDISNVYGITFKTARLLSTPAKVIAQRAGNGAPLAMAMAQFGVMQNMADSLLAIRMHGFGISDSSLKRSIDPSSSSLLDTLKNTPHLGQAINLLSDIVTAKPIRSLIGAAVDAGSKGFNVGSKIIGAINPINAIAKFQKFRGEAKEGQGLLSQLTSMVGGKVIGNIDKKLGASTDFEEIKTALETKLGRNKSDQEKAYSFLSVAFPKIQEEVRVISLQQLEVQEKQLTALNIISQSLGGSQVSTEKSKIDERTFLAQTGNFETSAGIQEDNIAFNKSLKNEMLTAQAGKGVLAKGFNDLFGNGVNVGKDGRIGSFGNIESDEDFQKINAEGAKISEDLLNIKTIKLIQAHKDIAAEKVSAEAQALAKQKATKAALRVLKTAGIVTIGLNPFDAIMLAASVASGTLSAAGTVASAAGSVVGAGLSAAGTVAGAAVTGTGASIIGGTAAAGAGLVAAQAIDLDIQFKDIMSLMSKLSKETLVEFDKNVAAGDEIGVALQKAIVSTGGNISSSEIEGLMGADIQSIVKGYKDGGASGAFSVFKGLVQKQVDEINDHSVEEQQKKDNIKSFKEMSEKLKESGETSGVKLDSILKVSETEETILHQQLRVQKEILEIISKSKTSSDETSNIIDSLTKNAVNQNREEAIPGRKAGGPVGTGLVTINEDTSELISVGSDSFITTGPKTLDLFGESIKWGVENAWTSLGTVDLLGQIYDLLKNKTSTSITVKEKKDKSPGSDILKRMYEKTQQFMFGLFDNIQQGIINAPSFLKGLANKSLPLIKSIYDGLAIQIGKAKNLGVKLAKFLAPMVETLVVNITDQIKKIPDFVNRNVSALKESIGNLYDSIKDKFNNLNLDLSGKWDSFKTVATDLMQSMIDKANGIKTAISNKVKSILDKIKNPFKGIIDKFNDIKAKAKAKIKGIAELPGKALKAVTSSIGGAIGILSLKKPMINIDLKIGKSNELLEQLVFITTNIHDKIPELNKLDRIKGKDKSISAKLKALEASDEAEADDKRKKLDLLQQTKQTDLLGDLVNQKGLFGPEKVEDDEGIFGLLMNPKKLLKKLGPMLMSALGFLGKKSPIIAIAVGAFDIIKDAVMGFMSGDGIIDSVWQGVKGIFSTGDGSGGLGSMMKGMGKGAAIGSSIAAFIGGPIGWLAGGVIGSVVGGIMGFIGFDKVATYFKEIQTDYIDPALDAFMYPFRLIGDAISFITTAVTNKIEGVLSILPDWLNPFSESDDEEEKDNAKKLNESKKKNAVDPRLYNGRKAKEKYKLDLMAGRYDRVNYAIDQNHSPAIAALTSVSKMPQFKDSISNNPNFSKFVSEDSAIPKISKPKQNNTTNDSGGFFSSVKNFFSGGSSSSSSTSSPSSPVGNSNQFKESKESNKSKTPSKPLNLGGSEESIKDMVKRHEGVRLNPYKDSLGLWTVGVGHLIGNGRSLPSDWNRSFSMDEIDSIFDEDFNEHAHAASKIPGFNKLNETGKGAMVDLTFNMGPTWFKKWPSFSKSVREGDGDAAARSLSNSRWYGQVGNRAPEIVAMMKSGFGPSGSKALDNVGSSGLLSKGSVLSGSTPTVAKIETPTTHSINKMANETVAVNSQAESFLNEQSAATAVSSNNTPTTTTTTASTEKINPEIIPIPIGGSPSNTTQHSETTVSTLSSIDKIIDKLFTDVDWKINTDIHSAAVEQKIFI